MNNLQNLIVGFQDLLNKIVPLLIMIGVVYFIWGVVQFFIANGEEAKTKGKDHVIYGLIGFAVIISLWGLVNIVTNFIGVESSTAPTLESLQVTSGSSCSLSGNPKIGDVLCFITKLINDSVIPLIFAIATVMFVWGVVNFFILNASEEAKRAQGKQFMIWGIVALAVMLSVWGLVGILTSSFGVGNVLPQVHPRGGSGN